MREILFRGKTSDGEWVEGFYSSEEYNIDTHSIEYIPRIQLIGKCVSLGVLPETVGQFTGLTDRNGRKIFEGDIVRYCDTIHQVVFEQRNTTAYFGLVYSEIETMPFGHYQDLKQIEVIGNIHDSPELLE